MQWFVHAANVCFLISFVVRDILWLRVLSIAGGFSLIPYFYFSGPEPQLAPIGWNIVFTVINVYQIYRLIQERRPVALSEGELRLYDAVFHRLSPRAFLRLLGVAQARDADAGASLVEQGTAAEELFLIERGRVAIECDGAEIAHLDAHQFVGEMSYLTGEPTSACARASEQTSYLCWQRATLEAHLTAYPDVRAGLQLILGADLADKLRAS